MSGKRKGDDDLSEAQPVQKKLKFGSASGSVHTVSQREVDELVLKYVVDSLSSLHTVEMDSFTNLVQGLAPGRTVMARTTLRTRIANAYSEMVGKLMQDLDGVQFVCTTADIWSSNRKSFLGMTIHWISKGNVRQSRALALRRITGSHTFDNVAQLICAIHEQFELDATKVVCTVTDNASNFKKAFDTFQICKDSDDEEDDDIESDKLTTVVDVVEILSKQDDSNDSIIHLPKHLCCTCHSLNLVATTDVEAGKIGSQQYSRIYHVTMGKCQALWNLVHRSSKASDTVSQITAGVTILIPCPTRWNSMYRAVQRLVELSNKLTQIFDELNLPKLNKCEIEFLKEYSQTMEPLASTLDCLQGDLNSFLGMLLPKLIQLRNRLKRMLTDSLQFCSPLANAQLRGIEKRFKDLLALDLQNTCDPLVKEAVLAAISHPLYKLKWVPPERRDEFSQYFVDGISRLVPVHSYFSAYT